MKNSIVSVLIYVFMLSFCAVFCQADINYNDGGTYVISTPFDDNVYVDEDKPGMGTRVEVKSTGGINFPYGLYAYHDSVITISGGDIQGRGLNLFDNCKMTMTDGDFPSSIAANDNSSFSIMGGSIGFLAMCDQSTGDISTVNVSKLFIRDNSSLFFAGGSVTENIFAGSAYGTNHSSLIKFAGSNFMVNGTPVSIGSSLRSYATCTTYDNETCLTGILTGTFANGGILNNRFYIYDESDIVVVPEPATLFLVGIGGLMLRRKKGQLRN